MDFRAEMMHVFYEIVRGKTEGEFWGEWWDKNCLQLKKNISPGDFMRIKPGRERPCSYDSLWSSQKGIVRYLQKLELNARPSNYYKIKMEQQANGEIQAIIQTYQNLIDSVSRDWNLYINQHAVTAVVFDWQARLGTPPLLKKITGDESPGKQLKARLQENIKFKIAPLAKAYGMKAVGPKTFVKEQNGIVTYLNFVGYFRGGGYETMEFYICPLYSIEDRNFGLPADILRTSEYIEMRHPQNWQVIQYDHDIDIQKIDEQFDRILTFLAKHVFPRWEQIKNQEAFFVPERLAYLKAMEITPPGSPVTSHEYREAGDAWGISAYLFGVWDLLSGNEQSGYEQLEYCLKKGAPSSAERIEITPDLKNLRFYSWHVLYHNAELFLQTRQYTDEKVRKQAIFTAYENVCNLMRRYYQLPKP